MGINEKGWLIGFKRMIGDESLGDVGGIAVDNTNKQLHVCDIADVYTDWALSSDSSPAVYIHGSASATEYMKINSNTISGTAIQINSAGTAIRLASTTSWSATGTGTVGALGVLGPAEIGSISCKTWLKFLDAAGTSIYWVPGFAP
jgi:hypothetical protein